MTSILEQLARRFDTYASDQLRLRDSRHNTLERRACEVRADVWQMAAEDLREQIAIPTPIAIEEGIEG